MKDTTINETAKMVIGDILREVIKNGSADRSSIIKMLTVKYKKLTGYDFPIEEYTIQY